MGSDGDGARRGAINDMSVSRIAGHSTISSNKDGIDVRAFTKAFDRQFWFDDVGYDAVSSQKKVSKLPARSDVSAAARVIGKFAHDNGADFNVSQVKVNGTVAYALTWQLDEVGGLELFNAKGSRFASQQWSGYPPTPAWHAGARSKTVSEIEAGKMPG